MNPLTRMGACLCLAASAWASWAGDHYDQGVAEYRTGRYASAWGHFYMAANEGDPDAARLALHMLRYGPVLYGGFWDASSEEVADWTRLAASSKGRPPPEYQPARRPLAAERPSNRRPKS